MNDIEEVSDILTKIMRGKIIAKPCSTFEPMTF